MTLITSRASRSPPTAPSPPPLPPLLSAGLPPSAAARALRPTPTTTSNGPCRKRTPSRKLWRAGARGSRKGAFVVFFRRRHQLRDAHFVFDRTAKENKKGKSKRTFRVLVLSLIRRHVQCRRADLRSLMGRGNVEASVRHVGRDARTKRRRRRLEVNYGLGSRGPKNFLSLFILPNPRYDLCRPARKFSRRFFGTDGPI